MPGFYGFQYVLADLHKQLRTGKVVSGTLRYRTAGQGDTFTSLTWNNLYIWPQQETTGFEGGRGYSDIDGMMTLYRTGESVTPRVDDQVVVAGKTYLIKHISPRLNADESNSFAVYDCRVTS